MKKKLCKGLNLRINDKIMRHLMLLIFSYFLYFQLLSSYIILRVAYIIYLTLLFLVSKKLIFFLHSLKDAKFTYYMLSPMHYFIF